MTGAGDVLDFGDGHVGDWITDPATGELIGMHEHHEYGTAPDGCRGGGYIAWKQTPVTPLARHQLVSGAPGDLEHLTISPSLQHRAREGNSPHPQCHGFIKNGKWVPAS